MAVVEVWCAVVGEGTFLARRAGTGGWKFRNPEPAFPQQTRTAAIRAYIDRLRTGSTATNVALDEYGRQKL